MTPKAVKKAEAKAASEFMSPKRVVRYVKHRARNRAAAYNVRRKKNRVRRDIVTNSTARTGPGQIRKLPRNRAIAPMPALRDLM